MEISNCLKLVATREVCAGRCSRAAVSIKHAPQLYLEPNRLPTQER
jgi:hypothetical protein